VNIIIIILIILVLIILIASIIIINQKKKIHILNKEKTSYVDICVLQNIIEIIGSKALANEKIKALNEVILENYNTKYSTIAIFDGYNYITKGSNIEKEYINILKDIALDNDFKSNIKKNVSKYITTTSNKTLLYKSAVERNIKSAMFSPIYCNGVYLGFWLLEDVKENAFDNISKNNLSIMKDNIGIFLEVIEFQKTIENAQKIDKQTGLYSNIYLYSGARSVIRSNDMNTIVMINLQNIPNINEKYGRNVGNILLVKAANCIKNFVNKNNIVVRYSGIRFIIIMPNISVETCKGSAEKILYKLNLEAEYVGENKITLSSQILLHQIKSQNDIELEIEKMQEYMDRMNVQNTIKVI